MEEERDDKLKINASLLPHLFLDRHDFVSGVGGSHVSRSLSCQSIDNTSCLVGCTLSFSKLSRVLPQNHPLPNSPLRSDLTARART